MRGCMINIAANEWKVQPAERGRSKSSLGLAKPAAFRNLPLVPSFQSLPIRTYSLGWYLM